MYLRDTREVLSSLVCLGAGAGIVVMSMGYELGTAFNMGPGYFPLILGGALLVVGVVLAFGAVGFGTSADREAVSLDLRALWALIVVAATFIGFALLLEPLGLALTCFVVLATAGFASRLLTIAEALVAAFLLAALCVVLFVYLLDLQISAWPW